MFLENYNSLYFLFCIIGLFFSVKTIAEFVFFLKRIYKPKVNILNKYGKGSYAIITGGSDGVGKAFALNFAQQGFNLILVARNKSKLEAVKNELLKIS